jgi:hypothetical protein
MNSLDYSSFCRILGVKNFPVKFCNIDGIDSFVKFLEIQELTLDDILPLLVNSQSISSLGISEILSKIIQNWSTKSFDVSKFSTNWTLWGSKSGYKTLDEIINLNMPLDMNFVALLNEKAIGTETLRMFLTNYTTKEISKALIPDNHKDTFKTQDYSVRSPITIEKPVALKKWRGAEHQVMQFMESQGWVTVDHSRENIGYDIACSNSHKKKMFLEVKSIDHSGQPFTITSNEEAVARQNGIDYYIVLVLQDLNTIQFNFIQDPINNLSMTRQCRQWVWECTDYKYEPLIVRSE